MTYEEYKRIVNIFDNMCHKSIKLNKDIKIKFYRLHPELGGHFGCSDGDDFIDAEDLPPEIQEKLIKTIEREYKQYIENKEKEENLKKQNLMKKIKGWFYDE